jgi:hypothetical protein
VAQASSIIIICISIDVDEINAERGTYIIYYIYITNVVIRIMRDKERGVARVVATHPQTRLK